jgi:hypothetical protein
MNNPKIQREIKKSILFTTDQKNKILELKQMQ